VVHSHLEKLLTRDEPIKIFKVKVRRGSYDILSWLAKEPLTNTSCPADYSPTELRRRIGEDEGLLTKHAQR
jgi:hypothetical protein